MEELWKRLSWLVDSAPGAAAKEEAGDLTIRIPSGPGLYSFVVLETEPEAIFSTVRRLTVETLVATHTPATDEDAEFLRHANTSAFGGSWQRFRNGDVGVVGSFLLHDFSAPSLAELLPQFLALQVSDAIQVGRPPRNSSGGLRGRSNAGTKAERWAYREGTRPPTEVEALA